jgi:hypothetical protein
LTNMKSYLAEITQSLERPVKVEEDREET